MSLLNIRRALIRGVKSMKLGVPISVENSDFQPPQGSAWVELISLPDVVESCGKGRSDGDFREGIFQVSIYDTIGSGTLNTLRLAEKVNNEFYHGKELTANSQVVQIDRVELEPAFRTGGFWHQPISVYYQTITQRT